ncbi:N-acetylneuraminate lyase [Mollicutes bacterium LVI A0039]|nr:N-acetylneuraminate lyase [Mollicutes bacterium LVI A0039]
MKGIISALVVPFTEAGQVDEMKLRGVVNYNIEVSGVDGLYINGSTGENFMLDTDTKKQIFKIVGEEVAGRVDLFAQIGSINLQEAIELGKYVKELGTYAVLSAVTPFYYKFSFEEIKNYYFTIIEECDMDMVIYNIPLLTGVSMSVAQFGELFANDRVVGVKFTATDYYTMERIKTQFPNKLLYSGFDECLLPSVATGIDGAIGSTYNFQASLAKEVMAKAEGGDLAGARVVQEKMNDAIDVLIETGLYQTIKSVLTLDGADAGICKLPMSKTEEKHILGAKKILEIIK